MINFQPTSICVHIFAWLQQQQTLHFMLLVASHITSSFNTATKPSSLWSGNGRVEQVRSVPNDEGGQRKHTTQCFLSQQLKRCATHLSSRPSLLAGACFSLLLRGTTPLSTHKQLPRPAASPEMSPQHLAGPQHRNTFKQQPTVCGCCGMEHCVGPPKGCLC